MTGPSNHQPGAQRPFFDSPRVGPIPHASDEADTAGAAPLAFYNEIDPNAAQWLRNLIAAGHIAPGVVDERSIADIAPEELYGFTQWHFFAGIGGWPLALRRVGWPDDRPVCTASAPCQPFSAAGAGLGFDDERHLWPACFHHVEQLRPPVVFGEQVASKAVDEWIDLVCADLEAVGYAVGAVPSAGIGAPHIRDRCYWLADAGGGGLQAVEQRGALVRTGTREGGAGHSFARAPGHRSGPGRMAHAQQGERGRRADHGALLGDGAAAGRHEVSGDAERGGFTGGLADTDDQRRDGQHVRLRPAQGIDVPEAARRCGAAVIGGERADQGDAAALPGAVATGPVNGLWRAADWLLCRDGKWRAVEPGTFPLAHGVPGRVGRLRAYGNAINVEAAVAFIEAYLAARRERLGLMAVGDLA